jgi:hypothetical protein
MKQDKGKDKQRLTELRATLPAPLEDSSDTAWQEFQALQASQEHQFEPTRPSTLPAPLAAKPDAAPVRVPAGAAPTLDRALQIARASNRACPLPEHWSALFELLQRAAPAKSIPPPTIDGAAWKVAPSMQKRLRLREQLEWAERHQALGDAVRFLAALPEDAWLHL